MNSKNVLLLLCTAFGYSGHGQTTGYDRQERILRVERSETEGTIAVYRASERQPILTQVAKADQRPYLHPIVAPDGLGLMTEYRPSHHPHQTGIYWGLKLVNGRDYFMNWNADYWRGISAAVLTRQGERVEWETVSEMIDGRGDVIMVETQRWSMQAHDGKYILDLVWKGEAKAAVTMGKFYVGGLFVRMPWVEETIGEIVNSAGLRNMDMEGQRAIWSDIGIQVDGRDDLAHIAILDHPDNRTHPTAWRVDSQFGLGPSAQILGDWSLDKGETEVFRYRLLFYTGSLDNELISGAWNDFALSSSTWRRSP